MRTSRLRKYSGAVHLLGTSGTVLSELPPTSVNPVQDLFLRVMIQYARLNDNNKRRDSYLTSFDTWCTERKTRHFLLFWMCVERYQNMEWKPVQQLCTVPMSMEGAASRIITDFLSDTSEYSICAQTEIEPMPRETKVELGTFRTIQSSVFNQYLLPEFQGFWDAHPTMHTTIEPSERATDGEVVMAVNLFLKEYYDFGEDKALQPPEQSGWRWLVTQFCA